MMNIAGGLAGRLRSLVAVQDRLDRLESGSGTWLATFEAEELPEMATELTLRALRTVANPTNFTVLKALATGDSRSLDQLMALTGCGRLVLSEQLNDLIQVGLAMRLIDTDHAQITAAGAGIIRLVETLSAEVAQQWK
jgi:DNA-binding HxlR family transcriptional regulator